MDVHHIYGYLLIVLIAFHYSPTNTFALSARQPKSSSSSSSSSSPVQINSNSVLVALLDSHYTELAELVEKALLLQKLEDVVGSHNITISHPRTKLWSEI
ncbi:Fasciclin-like arabinogalactan protein 17 [Bienertia sinuspersici]